MTSILDSSVTTVGVIALVMISIITGILVPGRTVKLLIKSKNEEIAMWKEIALQSDEARRTSLQYARQSLDVNRTAVHALDALAAIADQGDTDASAKAS